MVQAAVTLAVVVLLLAAFDVYTARAALWIAVLASRSGCRQCGRAVWLRDSIAVVVVGGALDGRGRREPRAVSVGS